ncbi:MAG: STAS domain-containing protein [Christensenellaceae bacterium]|jgi:stage II sporulation protein AA (anti-sigma F factor antagonist)|nr:STAS domain-containing protein [Christensenellaceae bacterium]
MKYEYCQDSLIIKLYAEIDHFTSKTLRSEIDTLILAGGFSSVVLDLKEITFIDSTGVGLILGRYKLLRDMNKSLYISSPAPEIDKVLMVSGVYTIVKKLSKNLK